MYRTLYLSLLVVGFVVSLALPIRSTVAADPPPAPDPAANQPAWIIVVAQAGIQRISGAALANAGMNLAMLDPAQLQLRLRGQVVPLEVRTGADGRLDPADEIRFYADPPGDRWNSLDRYRLTIDQAPGLRMAVRTLVAGTAPFQTTAFESGLWYAPTIYDSTTPGADGDHFFVADMRAGPDLPDAVAGAWLTPTLPLEAGSVQLRISGVADNDGPHALRVQIGGPPQTEIWSGGGAFERNLPVAANGFSLTLSLLSGANQSSLLIDRVVWERPVRLEFGDRGAAFAGWLNARTYRLSGIPAGGTLYDITDPGVPQVLNIPAGSTPSMAETLGGRRYLLAGPGTLHEPQLSVHQPVDLATPRAIDAIYIAPQIFHAALAPLLAQREQQGYRVMVVEPQAIYDAWSYGMADPDAIRSFLRYIRSGWAAPLQAAILVGDGTYDPRNYLGRNNQLFVPPYLAPVDPWIGETACETCYGQLDGASPLDDLVIDIQIGRLPVKNSAELAGLVAKLIDYETSSAPQIWRSRAVLLADDSDYAGDFAAELDAATATLPNWLNLQRVYFSPEEGQTDSTEPDAAQARLRTLSAMNGSAGLVVFMGHSHPFQWAANFWRDPQTGAEEYLAMLAFNDPDTLTNRERLPIVLAMTCRSSAFHTPAFSGTTIDERLLLNPNGGAAAVWGSSGLGVAYGHSALMRGFFTALAAAPPGTARLGTLIQSGYTTVLAQDAAHADATRTFLLLGDPLMTVRVLPISGAFLPAVMGGQSSTQ